MWSPAMEQEGQEDAARDLTARPLALVAEWLRSRSQHKRWGRPGFDSRRGQIDFGAGVR